MTQLSPGYPCPTSAVAPFKHMVRLLDAPDPALAAKLAFPFENRYAQFLMIQQMLGARLPCDCPPPPGLYGNPRNSMGGWGLPCRIFPYYYYFVYLGGFEAKILLQCRRYFSLCGAMGGGWGFLYSLARPLPIPLFGSFGRCWVPLLMESTTTSTLRTSYLTPNIFGWPVVGCVGGWVVILVEITMVAFQ